MKNLANTARRAFTLLELIAVVIVIAILAAIFIPKYFNYQEKVQKMHSVSLPAGAKDSVLGYAGEFITVTSNPKTGPKCLTQGIWYIEKAEKEGPGSIVFRGHQTAEGVTTRVTLSLTTEQFVEHNSGIVFELISKNSPNYDKVTAAFKGNDQVAKDPK